MAFLELWFEMASLELWLKMADEPEHSLSWGSDWRVLPIWVCELWFVRLGLETLSSSTWLTSLLVLGHYELCFVSETPLGVMDCSP